MRKSTFSFYSFLKIVYLHINNTIILTLPLFKTLFLYTSAECESQCENCTVEGTTPEMWKQKLATINDIRSHIISLEQEHKQHRKITHRLTRHGSK